MSESLEVTMGKAVGNPSSTALATVPREQGDSASTCFQGNARLHVATSVSISERTTKLRNAHCGAWLYQTAPSFVSGKLVT